MSKYETTAGGNDVVCKETPANVDETARAVIKDPEHKIPRGTEKVPAEAKSATSAEDRNEIRTRTLWYLEERFKRIQTMPTETPEDMEIRIKKGKEWMTELEALKKKIYYYNCSS